MVAVFREVRRVLSPSGTCWVNMGDGYTTSFFSHSSIRTVPQPMGDWSKEGQRIPKEERTRRGAAESLADLKPKDLIGMPWRLALALQADGWWLRADVIWAKPNPMPESVTDRPTKAHEYVFLLTKQARYFYDSEAVRESSGTDPAGRTRLTSFRSSALRPELSATILTDDGALDSRGWCDLGQPQVSIDATMATEACRLKVVEFVGGEVGIETPEGDLVVDLQSLCPSAHDTPMPVAVERCLSRLGPVGAAVVNASSSPRGAFLASHVDADPNPTALARAEVSSLELALEPGEGFAARLALNGERGGSAFLVWGTPGPTHKTNTTTGRNLRTVWNIPTQPQKEAHFATFPERLPELCILAGCPERVCVTCGKPSERVVDVSYDAEGRTTNGPRSTERRHKAYGSAGFEQRKVKATSTVGFTDCGHNAWRPGRVLDPFAGSGTTLHVARKHGRHSIGIELNPDYCELAARRLAQQSIFSLGGEL